MPQNDIFLNYRNLFIIVLEAEKCKIRYQQIGLLVRALLRLTEGHLLAVSSGGFFSEHTERAKQALGSLPLRTLILLGGGPRLVTSLNLNYFLRALPPNTAMLGVTASIYEFVEIQTFSP